MSIQSECEWFEIIDWDEDTNEIIHAVCTLPSPAWPNCNRCKKKAEYRDINEEKKLNRMTLLHEL